MILPRKILIFIILFFPAIFYQSTLFADSIAERYYLRSSFIAPAVLKDAIGTCSIRLQGSQIYKRYENGTISLDNNKLLCISSDAKRLKRFNNPGEAQADRFVNISALIPFVDVRLPETRTSKFMVLNTQGDFLQLQSSHPDSEAVWVRSTEPPRLLVPRGEGEYLFEPEISEISIYKSDNDSFSASGKIALKRFKPISGWVWNNQRSIRLPVTQRNENGYIEIVYDCINDLRVWIRPEALEASTSHNLNQTYFHTNTTQYVDLFYLTENNTRKLYDKPLLAANYQTISTDTRLTVNERNIKYGYDEIGYISTIENGFALLVHIDNTTGKKSNLGWIKIRDKKNRLNIWPLLPLQP